MMKRNGFAHTVFLLSIGFLIITAIGLRKLHIQYPGAFYELSPTPTITTAILPIPTSINVQKITCISDADCTKLNYCTNREPTICYKYECKSGLCEISPVTNSPTPKPDKNITCPQGTVEVCEGGSCNCNKDFNSTEKKCTTSDDCSGLSCDDGYCVGLDYNMEQTTTP